MVRRIASYDSGTGIGEGLSNLAAAFDDDPSSEAALVSARLAAERTRQLQEQGFNRDQVANLFVKLPNVDPNDPNAFRPYTAELYSRAVRAGMNPEHASNALLGYLSNTGAPDATVGRAFVGSGRGLNVNEGVSIGDREGIAARNARFEVGARLATRDPQIVTGQDGVPRYVATGQPAFPDVSTIREGYNYGPPAAGSPAAGSTGPATVTVPEGVPRGRSIGLDNNNPGNLRPGAPWEGAVGTMSHPDAGAFVQFDTPVSGIRAMTLNLLTQGRTAPTPRALLNRLAPSNDPADRRHVNQPDAYAAVVARALGIGIDDPINFSDPVTMGRLVTTIITMENGQQPYGPEILDAGIRRAYAAAARTGAAGQVAAADGAPMPQGTPAPNAPLRSAITGQPEPTPGPMPTAPAARSAGAVPVPGGPHDPTSPANRATNERELRQEIRQHPTVISYLTVAPIYRSMLETSGRDTRASDINLVYGLARIMDPGSVVREGEQVVVRNAASLSDQVLGAINGLNGGAQLTPETRRALMAEAGSRYQEHEAAFRETRDFYAGIARRNGWDVENVLPPFRPVTSAGPAAPGATTAPAPSPQGSAAPNPEAATRIQQAREAIAAGRSRADVTRMLRDMGITPPPDL